MKLDPSKKYQTRDGRDVVIYCWDAPETPFPIHGRIEGMNGARSWTANGCYVGEFDDPFDLIEVPRKPREWWVNMYQGKMRGNIMHPSKAEADSAAGTKRSECILVREVLEDE